MQSHEILDFLRAIDEALSRYAKQGETLEMYLLGRCALILGSELNLMTKDVDVVYLHGSDLQGKAEELFGKGTSGAATWGFYLETVSSGLPPIPNGYQSRSLDVVGSWRVLRPKQLEPHDLAITKLKRFHVKDRQDIQILCDHNQLTAERLQTAFESAFAFAEKDAPETELVAANIGRVLDYLDGKTIAL
jgi:hypothetical protein